MRNEYFLNSEHCAQAKRLFLLFTSWKYALCNRVLSNINNIDYIDNVGNVDIADNMDTQPQRELILRLTITI